LLVNVQRGVLSCAIGALFVASSGASASWTATHVVSYTPGTGVLPGWDDPAAALGMPTRFTAPASPYASAVTPFNPAFGEGEMVSIGQGGSLVLGFSAPIRNSPSNPFGIDLLVFGNAGYIDINYPNGQISAPAASFASPGVIEVSADGLTWHTITRAQANSAAYPTLGYLDLPTPYSSKPGSVLSDFRRPVDPSLDPSGMNYAQLLAAYDGSGGGVGVDLAWVGLDEISFVRISNPAGASAFTVQVDAITIVPAPGAGLALGVLAGPACSVGARRRRR
jgi:hypothetical protein